MAVKSGLNQRLYVEGNDLSGDTMSINNGEGTFDELDITDITLVAHKRLLTLAAGVFEWSSFFNDAAGRAHVVLSALPLPDQDITWALGTALGDPCISMVGKFTSAYQIARGRDAAMDITSRAEVSAGFPIEEGVMLTAADDTHSSATSNVGLDQSAQTALGASGFCHVLAIASGTPTFLTEDSADSTNGVDGAWATLLTFGAQAVDTAFRVSVTGTVERWVRATTTGTFTGGQFVMTSRRGLANDVIDLS